MDNKSYNEFHQAMGKAADSFQQVDQHVEDNHQAVKDAVQSGPAIPGTPEFCNLYIVARPVLLFVRGMLFFKPKWQMVISGLVGGLDAVCNPQV